MPPAATDRIEFSEAWGRILRKTISSRQPTKAANVSVAGISTATPMAAGEGTKRAARVRESAARMPPTTSAMPPASGP